MPIFRDYPGLPSYVVLVNVGDQHHEINLTTSFFDLPATITVVSSAARSLHRKYTLAKILYIT